MNLDIPITTRDIIIFAGVTLLAYVIGDMIDAHYRQLAALRIEQYRLGAKLEELTCPECIVERNREVAARIAAKADDPTAKESRGHSCVGPVNGEGVIIRAVAHG